MKDLALNEYQNLALKTAKVDYNNKFDRMINLTLGLVGESGEVADELKKIIFHDKELDKDTIKKELGDVLWYLACLSDELGFSLEEVAKANISKLAKRYPEGFVGHGELV